MRDNKNLLIAALSLTALLLTALLVVLNAPQTQSRASVTATAGDYSAASFAVSSSKDYVAVVDNPTRRLVVYRLDTNRKRIDVVDTRDLGKDMNSK